MQFLGSTIFGSGTGQCRGKILRPLFIVYIEIWLIHEFVIHGYNYSHECCSKIKHFYFVFVCLDTWGGENEHLPLYIVKHMRDAGAQGALVRIVVCLSSYLSGYLHLWNMAHQ